MKGQITFFILLGIIIVAVLGFVVMVPYSKPSFPDTLPVENFVLSCLDLVAKDGWAVVDDPATELSDYVTKNLAGCTGGFKDFPHYRISEGVPSAKVVVLPKGIDVVLDYPLTFNYPGGSMSKKDYEVFIDFKKEDAGTGTTEPGTTEPGISGSGYSRGFNCPILSQQDILPCAALGFPSLESDTTCVQRFGNKDNPLIIRIYNQGEFAMTRFFTEAKMLTKVPDKAMASGVFDGKERTVFVKGSVLVVMDQRGTCGDWNGLVNKVYDKVRG